MLIINDLLKYMVRDGRTNPRQTTQHDQRRLANCLLAAGFERNGKFTFGKQRNQVRFTRASEY